MNFSMTESEIKCLEKRSKAREIMFNEEVPSLEEHAKRRSDKAKENFNTQFYDDLAGNSISDYLPTIATYDSTAWVRELSKQQVEDKRKKEDKKLKKSKKQKAKHSEFIEGLIGDNCSEVKIKTPNLFAELIKTSTDILNVDGSIYLYDEDLGCYSLSDEREISMKLYSYLDDEYRFKTTSRDFKEAHKLLKLADEIHDDGNVFFANRPYVNCLNGVVDVMSGKLLPHSPKYRFKNCIRANYDPNTKSPLFLQFVDTITGSEKDLKRLLRSVLGYMWSHYNNAKIAVLLYATPHTGKSVLCSVTERVLGTENVSHVDMTFLHKQEYAASLQGKILNIAPDISNSDLRDVGFFKALVSHNDTISSRKLYGNPTDIRSEAKMLFSTNHDITFHSSVANGDIEAVFNRLLYIPFQNTSITAKEDNKHLSDDLMGEVDAIFSWAIQGLKDYVENNETFPRSELSEEAKAKNMSRYCPEKIFYDMYLKEVEGKYESTTLIRKAFEMFCNKTSATSKANIVKFLDERQRIPKTRKRIDSSGNLSSEGNPIHVYFGIRLRKKYRKLIEGEATTDE